MSGSKLGPGCLAGRVQAWPACEQRADQAPRGFVTPAEIYTFFKEIHVMWVNMGECADLAIYHVVDEILDMLHQPRAFAMAALSSLPDMGHCNANKGLAAEMGVGSARPCLESSSIRACGGSDPCWLSCLCCRAPLLAALQVKPKTATLITAEDLEVSGMSGCTWGWAEADALWEQAEQVYEGGGGDAGMIRSSSRGMGSRALTTSASQPGSFLASRLLWCKEAAVACTTRDKQPQPGPQGCLLRAGSLLELKGLGHCLMRIRGACLGCTCVPPWLTVCIGVIYLHISVRVSKVDSEQDAAWPACEQRADQARRKLDKAPPNSTPTVKRLRATCPSCTSCICRIFASLGRCIAAPPSVFCRYILILSLNLMASGRLSGWLARS
ncbi:hypothetical protein V8C86DRAFT_2433998 [Haematococcus lacustris]